MLVSPFRDLTVVHIDEQRCLIVACDSLGGIGMKPLDAVLATAEQVGHFSLRVPLLEVLAAGADPFLVIDTLCFEKGAYHEAVVVAMRALILSSGLADIVFNGSTEDNVATLQTGVGVTVLGMAKVQDVMLGRAQVDDVLLVVGKPKSAPEQEVRIADDEIIAIRDLLTLRAHSGVREIVPVGSQGVLWEAQELARSAGCVCAIGSSPEWLEASGGPSTCVVLACSADAVQDVRRLMSAPVTQVGWLRSDSVQK